LIYLQGDITKKFPVPEHSFDLVFCSNVLCHLTDEGKTRAMENIASILSIGKSIAVIGEGNVDSMGYGMKRYFVYRTFDGSKLENMGDVKSLRGGFNT